LFFAEFQGWPAIIPYEFNFTMGAYRLASEAANTGRWNGEIPLDNKDEYRDPISGVSADEDIGTRLGEPTLTVRLARRSSGKKLRPWFESGSSSRHVDWALSEVKVRRAFWGDAAPPPEDHDLHQEARSDWIEWEAAIAMAEVAADGVLRLQGGALSYDRTAGLKKL
jgi:hypothetical protein